MFTGNSSTNWKNKLLYFEWSPPWHLFVIVSDISPGNIDGIIFWHSILAFHLAFYLTFYSILASIEKSYLASFVASVLAFSLAFYLAFFLPYVLAYVLTFYSAILSAMLVWHSIWHLFWHSFLAFYLLYLQRFFAAEVWLGTLWSWACCSGPAGNTAI